LKDLHDSIASFRNAARYVRSSPMRLQRFNEFVKKEKIKSKSFLCLDIATRWNFTYLMLEHALKFQKVFKRMDDEDEDEAYSAYLQEDIYRVAPSLMDDWNNANTFLEFLRIFYTITLQFSGSLYVTSNACFHDIAHIQNMFQAGSIHNDKFFVDMANNMKYKYDKY